jgi:predicted TIM-barrel fold metal-dependent hydrolase
VTRVDARHHFWRTERQVQPWRTDVHAALAADLEPADLAPQPDEAGIDVTVLVESVDTAADDRLARYAAEFGPLRGPLVGTAGFYSCRKALVELGWDANDEHPPISAGERRHGRHRAEEGIAPPAGRRRST